MLPPGEWSTTGKRCDISEGFDAPRLDALFLVSPFKFKGKSIQQVGRVMRELETGKDDVEVHDYLDTEVSRLESMHHHRRRVLERKGFTIRTAPTRTSSGAQAVPAVPAALALGVGARPAGRPSVSEVRAWAREQGHDVSERGRLRSELWEAWHAAHPVSPASTEGLSPAETPAADPQPSTALG